MLCSPRSTLHTLPRKAHAEQIKKPLQFWITSVVIEQVFPLKRFGVFLSETHPKVSKCHGNKDFNDLLLGEVSVPLACFGTANSALGLWPHTRGNITQHNTIRRNIMRLKAGTSNTTENHVTKVNSPNVARPHTLVTYFFFALGILAIVTFCGTVFFFCFIWPLPPLKQSARLHH